ncbi:MAG: hypothetical protein ACRDKE_05740 [Solirubrobacterales bacterium]
MIDENRPTDLLYVAALGADIVNYAGISRDRMFAAIEALKLADPAESDRWASLVPERGVRKSFDSSDAAIVARAEAKLRELGRRYESNDAAQREFHMIVSALRGLELVEEAQIARWYDELIVREEPAPSVDGTFTRLYGLTGLELGRFVRLIAPPVERRRGLRINTIEVFEQAIAIRWNHVAPEAGYDGTLAWPSDESEEIVSEIDLDASLTDDVGTDYGPEFGGSSSSRSEDGAVVSQGVDVRSPAAPSAATLLTYRRSGFDLAIPIGHDG